MSVSGLRYTRATHAGTPLETRSGSYIYDGAPNTFHDWEFRTAMRLKLYEDAIRAKSKPSKGDKSIDPDDSDDSRTEAASPTRAAADPPVPSEDRPDVDPVPQPSEGGPPRPPTRAPKTSDAGSVKSTAALPMDESTSYAIKARTEMVHKVLEGLRDEAFELARDIGIEALTAPGGLRDFISRMRNVVFPRAAEEARELFRAGQRNGALARQGGESMLSYVSRRRRWWKLLKSLDSSIELSEPMRVELLLELSGLSRQEALVIKACTSAAKSFEAVSATLVEHYSGTHLKEGRSLGGGGTFQDRRNSSSSFGTRSRAGPKGYGKGKGRGFTRRAYIAEDEAQFAYDDAYHHEDEDAEEYDDTSYPAFGDEIDYEPHSYPAAEEEEDPSYEEFELDEDEALALNCLEELDPEEAESGHAIQLQLAANAAFGKAKGRKGKGRGKGKGKGKVVRSHLTLDERRDKMKALKAKSKCLRCGAIGHWAGDPECKFPTQKGGKPQGKGRAHLAIVAPKQDPDGGLYVPSGNDEDPHGHMMTELRSKAAPPQPSSSMQMEGGDRRFSHGQHKGMTFEEVSRKAEFVKWALLQPSPPTHLRDFLVWFNKYYTIMEGQDNKPYRETRASVSIPEGTYNPRPRGRAPKKTPPNPPKDRCANCTDFTYAGSSANFVRKTCRDCGHVSQEKREHVYTIDPSVCPHEATDHRGSSRTTSRTFCRMCGTFVDEVPQDFHRERKAVSEKLLEATEQALPIVQALTADDATADLNQEAVEQLMAVFQDRVTNAMAQEERIHPAALHEWLREAIVSVMEQSPASPSWGFVPTAMVARGRSPGRHKGKGKGKPKVKGKPQAPEQPPTTTAEPEFYRISDPFGADTFLGSRDPEMDADYREAILVESFRAESELNDPFPGGSSDDGAPGSYNVDELDDALERQNAEDEAQRELDEAFARARQQIAGEEEPDTITVLESASAQANRLQVRHVAGRELQRLDYQARNPVHIPAVPHWHGPTDQDRDEENRAQADAWHRRRAAILAEAEARLAERNPSGSSGARNPSGSSSSAQPQNTPKDPNLYPKGVKSDLRVAAASSVELRSTDVAQAYVQVKPKRITQPGNPMGPVKRRWVPVPPVQDQTSASSSSGAAPERSVGLGKGSFSSKPRWVNRGKGRGTPPSEPKALSPEPSRSAAPAPKPEAKAKPRWNNPRVFPRNIAGAGSTPQGDLVRIDNLPLIDMWSSSEVHVWGALDEGCNSTCHSVSWGRLAEQRLKALGLTFPWVDSKTKSFAGLGATSSTLGKRRLPFSIEKGSTTLGGVLESHEIDTPARNPLLLSLFAQSTLGLIKDMRTCTCSIRNDDGSMSHVPLARCSETGLLLLCLSSFQEDLPECVKHLRDPKARPRSRPLKPQGSVAQEQQSLARVLDPGTHSGSGEGTGDRPSPVAMVLLAPVPNYEGLVNGCFCSNTSVYYNKPANEWPNIIIFTGGARYQFDAQGRDRKRINHKDGWVDAFPVAVRNFNVRLHDLRGLNDPHEGAFSQCVGRHPGILEGVLSSPAGRHILTSCFKDIEMAVDGHKPLVVLPYCTSNRHRSVAIGTLISAGLYVLGMDHFLGHLHANASWAEMKCGGKCVKCRGHFDHAEATQLGNRVLAQLDPQVTRYATHPVDRQRSRGGGGTVPDPAAHSAPPPATRGTSL